ncbi:MAG: hypothetical protein ACXIUB_03865 [Wenzhouxiangella sp.]
MGDQQPKTFQSWLNFTVLASLIWLLSASAWALNEHDREILSDFFIASNGEQWLNNEGWLAPGSDPCDWHGIECLFDSNIGRRVVYRLTLPANNLTGTLDTRIFEVVHSELILRDNRLSGELLHLPGSPGTVDLANNRLSGEIPSERSRIAAQVSGSHYPTHNWQLDLSGNVFSGEIPEEWSGTRWLSLANNHLEGLPLSLLQPGFGAHFLDLSDNRFSGLLAADEVSAESFAWRQGSRWGGGLNLCWNDFEIDDPELLASIGSRHVGGPDVEACLGVERFSLAPDLSGSWFDPARSGEGISLQILDRGEPMVYWFTFDEEGNQMWLFEVGKTRDAALDWRHLKQTRGRFGQGLDVATDIAPMETRGSLRLDRTAEDTLQAERVYITDTWLGCFLPYPPQLNCFGRSVTDRLDYRQLTRLAGTRCDETHPMQSLSGAWFDPDRNGEGFILEVLANEQARIYWFTYQPDDSGLQAWMTGTGSWQRRPPIIGPPQPDRPMIRLDFDSLYQPVGTRHGEDFDPDEITRLDWGSLRIDFMSDGSGRVQFDSNFPEFGEGEFAIQQLSRPKFASCHSD